MLLFRNLFWLVLSGYILTSVAINPIKPDMLSGIKPSQLTTLDRFKPPPDTNAVVSKTTTPFYTRKDVIIPVVISSLFILAFYKVNYHHPEKPPSLPSIPLSMYNQQQGGYGGSIGNSYPAATSSSSGGSSPSFQKRSLIDNQVG